MVIIRAENYDTSAIPKPCVRAHFDGEFYYFAENESDNIAIEEMIAVTIPE